MIRKLAVGVAFAVLAAGAANAQTAGTFGSTSEGTFNINASLAPVVKVSGLNNLAFNIDAAFLNGSNPNINQNFTYCVYSNVSSAGSYKLRINGGTPDPNSYNGWLLNGAGSDKLVFYVNSQDQAAGSGNQLGDGDLFPFETENWYSNRPDTGECTDTGENTKITVAIKRSDILAANAGNYSGTVRVIASVP